MARARNIKPALFENELLGDADPMAVLTFIGLWTIADREGRLECRPKRIAAQLFPYRQVPDMPELIGCLSELGFLEVYEIDGGQYIEIINFEKHQKPHQKEKAKEYPESPPDGSCRLKLVPADKSSGLAAYFKLPAALNVDSPLPNTEHGKRNTEPDPYQEMDAQATAAEGGDNVFN